MSAVVADSPTPPPAAVRAKRAEKNKRRRKRRPPPGSPEPRSWLRAAVDGAKQLVAVGIFASLLVAATFGAYRIATTTPRFAIKKLEVTGARRLDDRQLAKLGGVKLGDNIFAVDTRKVRQKLLSDPWIRDAKVSRQLLNTLRVEIDERQAGALASIGGSLFLVTRAGEPFKAVEAGDPFDLPVVTGISSEYLARDRAREIERIGMAMEVLRHYERIPMSRVFEPEEVHIAPGGAVVLTVGKDSPVALHLGRGPWRKKLLMAARVVSRVQKKGQRPGIVFLDNEAHPERVVVRMR